MAFTKGRYLSGKYRKLTFYEGGIFRPDDERVCSFPEILRLWDFVDKLPPYHVPPMNFEKASAGYFPDEAKAWRNAAHLME